MDISANGLVVIREREGCVLHWYRDSRGIWTCCVGHTSAAGPPIPAAGVIFTEAEADQILHRDLAPIIAALNQLGVALTQYQVDALCSLIFNIGLGNWNSSTVRRMLLAKNIAAAGRAILMWNKPSAIMARREGEYVQFVHAEYVAQIAEKAA